MLKGLCVCVTLLFLACGAPVLAQESCSAAPLAVQVLGSGGPYAGVSDRASSGYLVWRNGRALVMVDAGGGTFTRFGEARARLRDLSLLAISHLHPDHVSDLPALMWLSDSVRQAPLMLAGPSAGGQYPDMATFVERLFDSRTGAFSILGGALRQSGRGVPLDVKVVDVDSVGITTVLVEDDLEVTGIGVPHSTVDVAQAVTPAVAYRVEIGGRSVVFSSDQNGQDERFVEFAAGADVLVMHFAISSNAIDSLRALHATPEIVGQIAKDAGVRHLVLSHFIEAPSEVAWSDSFSVPRLSENVAVVREIYDGPITVADDLECIRF